MKISIAMATYNGAKYLEEQLASFAAQTRLPDELVVCDDLSTDDTWNILSKFSRTAPFMVKLMKNNHNYGYIKNFEKAISLCSGDIIFLSDQDDVWFDKKIKVIEDNFFKEDNVLVIINDNEITDEFLTPSGGTLFSNSRALGYDDTWLSAGCCTAFRASFKSLLIPFPADLLPHDTWIHRLALGLKVRKFIPDILQYYRRHSINISNSMASANTKKTKLTPILQYGLKDSTRGWMDEAALSNFLILLINNRFKDLEKMNLAANAMTLASLEEKKVKVLENRINLLKRGRIKRFLGVLFFYKNGGYRNFSGWRSMLKDLIR